MTREEIEQALEYHGARAEMAKNEVEEHEQSYYMYEEMLYALDEVENVDSN